MKIRYSVATIHPRLGRLSLLCSEYIQVSGQFIPNLPLKNIVKRENINLKKCLKN